MRTLALMLATLGTLAFGAEYTINSEGINSKITGLDGSGIEIGQAEGGRPGKAGYDAPVFSAPNTVPTGVYFQNQIGMDDPNSLSIQQHATLVAGVMIGKTTSDTMPMQNYSFWEGVAPEANLHSVAIANSDDVTIALALNRIATLSGLDVNVRAINMSFGHDLTPFVEDLDGNSHFTQFVDWSASREDVLYVSAWGNIGSGDFRAPTDNFNGVTVAASTPVNEMETTYRKFSVVNAIEGDAVGDRTSIDLLAPGEFVRVIGLNDEEAIGDGTSLAAPHVTGAVSLLQQYAQNQIDIANPRFNVDRSRRHEVMKALMLNSADKLAGVHGSKRDVLNRFDQNWTQSPAYTSLSVPLDEQMGAGHLNVERAITQFSSGEYDLGTVPMIGWDYGNVGGSGQINEYILEQPVEGDQYIAITLTWDRFVDKITPGDYSEGDQFSKYQVVEDTMNNLDLHLMTKDGTDLVLDSIWTSQSFEDNVEHIFFKFREHESGEYKIVVHHNGGLDTSQDYALAWWYGSNAPPIPGDYDNDGIVDSGDYDLFRSSFGSTTELDADGNDDQVINAADYVIWRDNLGAGSGSGSLAPVPEPSAAMLLLAAGVVFGWRRAARERAAPSNHRPATSCQPQKPASPTSRNLTKTFRICQLDQLVL